MLLRPTVTVAMPHSHCCHAPAARALPDLPAPGRLTHAYQLYDSPKEGYFIRGYPPSLHWAANKAQPCCPTFAFFDAISRASSPCHLYSNTRLAGWFLDECFDRAAECVCVYENVSLQTPVIGTNKKIAFRHKFHWIIGIFISGDQPLLLWKLFSIGTSLAHTRPSDLSTVMYLNIKHVQLITASLFQVVHVCYFLLNLCFLDQKRAALITIWSSPRGAWPWPTWCQPRCPNWSNIWASVKVCPTAHPHRSSSRLHTSLHPVASDGVEDAMIVQLRHGSLSWAHYCIMFNAFCR